MAWDQLIWVENANNLFFNEYLKPYGSLTQQINQSLDGYFIDEL